jgi:hypothetical protein
MLLDALGGLLFSLFFWGCGGFCAFKNHEHFCPLLITMNPFIPVNWLECQRQVNCEATKHTCRSWCFARFQCKGPLLQRTDTKYNRTCIDSWVDGDNMYIYTLSGNDRNIAATTVANVCVLEGGYGPSGETSNYRHILSLWPWQKLSCQRVPSPPLQLKTRYRVYIWTACK